MEESLNSLDSRVTLLDGKLQSAPEVEPAHQVGPVNKAGQHPMIVRMLRMMIREEILDFFRLAKKPKLFATKAMKLHTVYFLTTPRRQQESQHISGKWGEDCGKLG